jgi:hypothetical protein
MKCGQMQMRMNRKWVVGSVRFHIKRLLLFRIYEGSDCCMASPLSLSPINDIA